MIRELRIEQDLRRLDSGGVRLLFNDSSRLEFDVDGVGLFCGRILRLIVELPPNYPFEPPLLSFSPPIYHPNVAPTGQICLFKNVPRAHYLVDSKHWFELSVDSDSKPAS